MTYGWYGPESSLRQESNPGFGAVSRHGRVHLQATPGRRWVARVVDGVLVTGLTIVLAVIALVAITDASIATVIVLAAYPAALVVFGVLYGCTVSPGQLLTAVVSLRMWTGRRVGAWRGTCRYLGVGFAPLWVAFFLATAFSRGGSAGAGYTEPVGVLQRRGLQRSR